MKKPLSFIPVGVLLLILLFCFYGCGVQQDTFAFQYWNEDSSALAELTAYVEAVTGEGSEDYIPEEDRIAVFDLDGTLMGETAPTYFDWVMYSYRVLEDPDYAGQATKEMVKTAETIKKIPVDGIPELFEYEHIRDNAKAFAGMTTEEFEAYVRAFLKRDVDGFDNLKYEDLFYKPMLEVVTYLQDKGFTVFVVSGTDTQTCRIVLQDVVSLPSYQIIGSVYSVEPEGQGDKDSLNYSMTAEDKIVRDGSYVLKNVKVNKIKTMWEHVGAKPVLSFGNSSGDFSIAMMTTSDNPYLSKAFFILADDEEREYGDVEKAASFSEEVKSNGWSTFSMKDDWSTIYGNEAVRTSRSAE